MPCSVYSFFQHDSFIRTNRATVALFVGFRRKELRESPKRAKGVAVFEGSPNWYNKA